MKFVIGPWGPWEITIRSPIYLAPEGETGDIASAVEKVKKKLKRIIDCIKTVC